MASVFLSYDREDVDRASKLAFALEKAGHSVWWDRHIKSGAQYSKEIETALKAADAVVVLWSERSIESTWVRDEAAAGRDSGRLVPVTIGKAEPPLGFRQYQTTDLSRWNGRATSAQFQEMLGAVEALGNDQKGESIAPASKPAAHRRSFPLMLAVALAAILIAAMIVWQPWNSRPGVPVVAVQPANGSQGAIALANDLLVQLGSLQSSNANALHLVDQGSETRPDLIFKIGNNAEGVRAGANLALLKGKSGSLLWSRYFPQPGGSPADLKQQIAYSAAVVLQCASEALSTDGSKLDQQTLKLYLSGCSDQSNLLAQNPQLIVPTFVKVTKQAPTFPGGWAKLLLVEAWMLISTDMSDQELRRDMRSHIKLARRVNPSMAEAFLAEGWIQNPRPISGWMKFVDLAVANDPDNPEVLGHHSFGLVQVGLMQEALADARRAAAFSPLSPSARETLIENLLNNGQVEAARNELERSERLWPGATITLQSRFAFEARAGDPARALLMLRSGELRRSPTPAAESYLKARIEPSSANIERAVTDARALYRQDHSTLWIYVETLALFERHEELVDVLLKVDPRVTYGVVWVLFRPVFTTLHKDRRFIMITHRFGVIDYWRETGKWADFCSRPDLPYSCKSEATKLAT